MAELMYYTTHEDTTTGVTSHKLKGYKYNRQFLTKVETKVQFPECPAVRSTGINPSVSYSIAEIQNKISSSLFVRSKQNTAEDFVLAQHLKRDESCVAMMSADMITFNSSNTWSSVTYSGTAEVSIDLGAREITCISSGTIFNIKVLNASGELIEWYPCSEVENPQVYDVLGAEFIGELSNNSWTTQSEFIYNIVYGCTNVKSLSISPADSYTVATLDTLSNRVARYDYVTENGYTFRNWQVECDGNGIGAPVNDPDGYPSGEWINVKGEDCLNFYLDATQGDVEPSSGYVFNMAMTINSGKFKMVYEEPSGEPFFNRMVFYDSYIRDAFKARILEEYSIDIDDYVDSIQKFMYALNGGEATTATGFPNGSDDDYPETSLGVPAGVTSSWLRGVLSDLITDVSELLQYSYDDGHFSNTSVIEGTRVLARSCAMTDFSLYTTENNGRKTIEIDVVNIEATGSPVGEMEYFLNYDKLLVKLIAISAYKSDSNFENWARVYSLSFDSQSLLPAKYPGVLKQSSEDVEGNALENTEETDFLGNHAKRLLAYTDSSL